MQAEVQQFLRVRRVQHRQAGGDEDLVREIGDGGRLGTVVIPRQRQHTTESTGAGAVGMAQHITAAVHSGTLAIPDAKDAVDTGAREAAYVLRTPDGGGCQIFVDGRSKDDIVLLENRFGLPQVHVVAPQRRATVTGNIAAGFLALGLIAQALLDRQAHQRLRARQKDPALFDLVFIGEGDVGLSQLVRRIHRLLLVLHKRAIIRQQ